MRSTRSSMRSSPRTSPRSGDHSSGGGGGSGAYPLPAYLNFCPGGLAYPRPGDDDDKAASGGDGGGGGGRSSSDDPASFADAGGGHSHVLLSQVSDPVRVVSKAMECDVQLQVQRRQRGQVPHAPPPAVEHVPSLSFLVEAIFHPLTGVPAAQVRHWLDSILLSYFSLDSTANMGDDGACSNCTLAAAFTGSTLDITADRGGGTSKGAVGGVGNVHAPPSLHSRSYSGESSTGSIGSSFGGGGSMSGMSGVGGPYSASSSGGGGGGSGTTTSVQFQSLLKHLASHHSGVDGGAPPARRPCGYVFKRGDIAWNCRTCQTDPTCVLCDKCFHNSNHEGHEVFFHRTSPGGCCDCGDVEAWRVEGCCDAHRPDVSAVASGDASGSSGGGAAGEDAGLADLDEHEAIRAALRGRESNADSVKSLPPCLRSALGVVIGAAVKCVVTAIDGAGVGADVSQWKIRWAEQVAKIFNKCVHDEEYALSDGSAKTMGAYITPQEILDAAFQPSPGHNASPSPSASPSSTPNTWSGVSAAGAGGFSAASSDVRAHSFAAAQAQRSQPLRYPYGQSDHQQRHFWEGQFPQNFKLQLRLHNDDVHTFDEVIDALYERSPNSSSGANGNSESDAEDSGTEGGPGLVSRRDDADSMTHHVDSDGQVTVKNYTSFRSALRGFHRLKARGLLCSVVSTPQVDLEMRARSVLRWLMEMSKLHPGVAALVVHALVDVTGGEDTLVDGCCVWPEPRMACFPWNGTLRSEVQRDDLWWTREDFRLHYWTKKDQFDEKSGSGGMEMDHVVNAATTSSSAANHLHGCSSVVEDFDPTFYSNVPFHLPSESLRKSPHALWGTLPTPIRPMTQGFPDDGRISPRRRGLMIVDTDIRKQQEADTLTKSLHPHRLAGLSILSGVSLLDDGFVHPTTGRIVDCTSTPYTAMHDLTVSEREIQYLIGSQLHGGCSGGGKTSFQSPYSPLLLMMLLDPYPTKQFRHAMHNLFLSLLTESRFKARFAASLGVVAYRPLTTLFCAGVGTESDTPLGFTVQILTAGSLVRALGNGSVSASLLECDNDELQEGTRKLKECEQKQDASIIEVPTFALPIALTILRAIHTNLLGATKEVKMLLENTAPATPAASAVSSGAASSSPNAPVPPSLGDDHQVTYRQLQQNMMLSGARSTSSMGYNSTTVPPHSSYGDAATFSAAHAGQGYLPALVYQNGEHPQSTLLPAAPDDGFLDSRSTRHKRLPHLLRDLEYVFETPGTALCLLLQLNKISENTRKSLGSAITPTLSEKERKVLAMEFPTAFARLLRLAQNMDPQKRKISGGHVEYEQQRWLDAFGLSLNLSGMRDALVESPSLLSSSIASSTESPRRGNTNAAVVVGSVPKPLRVESTNRYYLARHAMGNLFTALLREIKLCLYREGLLENGLLPASYTQAHPHHSGGGLTLTEAVQRSTLHVSSPNVVGVGGVGSGSSGSNGVALACATGVKMTEAQLNIIESALRYEYGYYASNTSTMDVASGLGASPKSDGTNPGGMGGGVIMGDWLKVPHTPLSGDALSFHLPLHRALARSIKSLCSIPVPDIERNAHPSDWWKLPILDGQDYYIKEKDDGAQLGAAGGHSSFFQLHNHLAQLLLPTLRSSNCRVVWSNPDTSPEQNSIRRFRTYTVSSAIAAAKVVHSLADHPLRCLAASNQIEKHLWARNGSAAAGMALNYASAPLCKSFRDLDLCLLQFSAAGFDVGLGARRTLALMLSRFSMDGYLVDPVLRRTSSSSVVVQGKQQWVHPPRLQDPDHAPALAESFFATVCLLVTELPPPPPQSMSDDTALKRSMRRELLHALAAEPRSYSEALAAAVSGATRRDHHLHQSSSSSMDDSTDGSQSLRTIFGELLREIARERQNTRASMSTRSGSGAPSYELTAQCSDEYDPTFYHLRRSEHQHAMDTVARLRKVKCSVALSTRTDRWGGGGNTGMRTRSMANASAKGDTCLPLVAPPPEAHPRFLPARLILHLPTMDSALRRKLLFALTGGQWLPPPEPQNVEQTLSLQSSTSTEGMSAAVDANASGAGEHMGVVADSSSGSFGSLRSNSRRSISSTGNASNASGQPSQDVPFSPAVVASSSVSSLEVLQILTLQVHTLEHCAALHRTQTLDIDSAQLSSTISVNSYLTRLCYVPSSLENCWALQCPSPLPSAGSGQRRGSILGLMIALYEHSYATSGSENEKDGNIRTGGQQNTDDSHSGGARTLASDGLKWLLRFVHALVHGAVSVTAAVNSATDGIPIRQQTGLRSPSNRRLGGAELLPPWTISEEIQTTIQGMLENLPKLWPADERSPVSSKTGVPKSHGASSSLGSGASGVSPISGSEGGRSSMTKMKMEARKAAQLQALERMREQQKKFAASLMSADDKGSEDMDVDSENDSDEDIDCIICRCAADDSDSPLGFLGHVQRSRMLQLRSLAEQSGGWDDDSANSSDGLLFRAARVVGDRGCQLRATACMDSDPVACLPHGSIVNILQSKVSQSYGLLSRRVLVRHVAQDEDNNEHVVEGWASVQSSQGYVILSPLSRLCYSRWGSTRPILRLCGHAAHAGCVEAHCLSLHQRAAGDHPYDGRFAANIEEGEFLCPLCKQLSNVLVPKHSLNAKPAQKTNHQEVKNSSKAMTVADDLDVLRDVLVQRQLDRATELATQVESEHDEDKASRKEREASKHFGSQLSQAMQISWENHGGKRRNKQWLPALGKWDYEDDESAEESAEESTKRSRRVGNVLRILREQHIAWASVGHGAASAEASMRTTQYHVCDGSTPASTNASSAISDPWTGYDHHSRDSHPNLLELRRVIEATSGFLEVVGLELTVLCKDQYSDSDSEQLLSLDSKSAAGVALVGQLLFDALSGQPGGLASSMLSPPTEVETKSRVGEWQFLSAFIASVPCHVARDGIISQRHEARATAAAMWAAKGYGTASIGGNQSTMDDGARPSSIPPAPLCVKKLCEGSSSDACLPVDDSGSKNLPDGWGTSSLLDVFSEKNKLPRLAFRPLVASAFMCQPLLAWDLSTFAGALISSLLYTGSTVKVDDLASAVRILLVARMVQALITPNGYRADASCLLDSSSASSAKVMGIEKWSSDDVARESRALASLRSHCVRAISGDDDGKADEEQSVMSEDDGARLLKAVGNAVLPFARTLVLLLRAALSTVRQQQRKRPRVSGTEKTNKYISAEKKLQALVENATVMECGDGLHILRALGGPSPTNIMLGVSSDGKSHQNEWLSTIDRWLAAVTALESHHGSRGCTTHFDPTLQKWIPSYAATLQATGSLDSAEGELKEKTPESVIIKSIPDGNGGSRSSGAGVQGATETANGTGPDAMDDDGSGGRSVDLSDADVMAEGDHDAAADLESFDEDDEEYEDEDMDDEEEENDDHSEDAMQPAGFQVNFGMVDDDDMESDEEMDAEGPVNFDEALGDPVFFGLPRRAVSSSAEWKDEDEESSDCSASSSLDGATRSADREFVDVSRAAIIPFQPSLLALESIGPGPRGNSLDMAAASSLMYDMSHLGLVHRNGLPGSSLVRLPRSFVELYSLVNKVKGDALDDQDEGTSSETAICLVTGVVMRSGSVRRAFSRGHNRPAGACTIHARKVGSGIGIFFLVQKCTVLLMHNNKSAYSASLYVDENGEEDPGLRRGRPLFLQESKYEALEALWRQHGIPREVAQIRSTSDRVIRDNWY